MREITDFDLKMLHLMDCMKEASRCIDKQVVCFIVDSHDNIVSIGINKVLECDRNCHDKEHRICVVDHAEKMALKNLVLSDMEQALEGCYQGPRGRRAYVNLFPCAPCQKLLDPYVDEIVTFGMAHKNWVSDKIVLFGHPVYSTIKRMETDSIYKTEALDAFFRNIPDGDSSMLAALELATHHRDDPTSVEKRSAKRAEAYRQVLKENSRKGVIAYTKSNYNWPMP